MDYRKEGTDYILRMDPGEDFMTDMVTWAKKEGVQCASVQGIGALNEARLGVFNKNLKTYFPRVLKGFFEVISCLGNISVKPDGSLMTHIHMTIAQEDGQLFAGHFLGGTVDFTMELFIRTYEKPLKRKYLPEENIFKIDFE